MSAVGDFRQYVKSILDPALGLTLLEGKLDEGLERRDVGCIYPAGTHEIQGAVGEQEVMVIVRVFVPFQTARAIGVVFDPGRLEEYGELIQVAMRDNQVAGGVWFSRVQTTGFDLDKNMVEAHIVATMQNLALYA